MKNSIDTSNKPFLKHWLFRAKSKTTKEWLQGELFSSNNHNFYINTPSLAIGECSICCEEIDYTTISECTGIEDVNGKLVFVGDIVRFKYLQPTGQPNLSTVADGYGVIVWDKYRFAIDTIQKTPYINRIEFNQLFSNKGVGHIELEVVGNIHDDPIFKKLVDKADYSKS